MCAATQMSSTSSNQTDRQAGGGGGERVDPQRHSCVAEVREAVGRVSVQGAIGARDQRDARTSAVRSRVGCCKIKMSDNQRLGLEANRPVVKLVPVSLHDQSWKLFCHESVHTAIELVTQAGVLQAC